ncbi:MAG TPA: EscU/YscU/HrcU family type III secretion system export apparatus switch protein [Clostridia bacterium]|nr:EscU/YscU/HrcU family type III secretion system export apparatus switch protein [Clostridia bacterium]
MGSDNKTEQPTPRRRDKAREQGQIARSRELPGALSVFGALMVLAWQGPSMLMLWRDFFTASLRAAEGDLRIESPLLLWSVVAVGRWVLPAVAAAWTLAVASSLAQGGLVWAPAALAFKPERLSPASKLGQLFSTQAVSGVLKSLLPAGAVLYLSLQVLEREWVRLVMSANLRATAVLPIVLECAFEIGWKCGLALLAWAGADYLLVRQKLEGELKMSREEVREEMKQSEGNPAVKGRIRRLQRQVQRRRMLQDVERATVVVVNPTHFAIALEYQPDMAAPTVIAKGRNLLAEQIKQTARWHNVPIVENPPLAHALYRATQVGQAIPAKLYAAVAEILAFVYRAEAAARARGRR